MEAAAAGTTAAGGHVALPAASLGGMGLKADLETAPALGPIQPTSHLTKDHRQGISPRTGSDVKA
jgi:hypothetical protein